MEKDLSRNILNLNLIKVAKWFMLTVPILMLFYKDCGFSTEESFQLKAFYSIAIVIFEIPSGYMADVIGRKRTIVIGSIFGTLGFAIYSFFTGYWYFFFAEFTLGFGMSCISGADSALLYDSLKSMGKEQQYVKYEGRNFSIGNFSEALAGITGGALAEISLRLPFYFQTVVALIAVPASFLLVEPKLHMPNRQAGWKDIWRVLDYALVKNAGLRYHLIYSSIIGALTLTMAWVIQLYLADIGFSEFNIGMASTFLNLLVGFVTLYAYRIEKRLSPRFTVWATTIVFTGSFVVSGLVQSAWIMVVFAFFYAARGVATPVLKDYINKLTTSDVRATVLSVRSLIIRGFFALVGPLFGWFTDAYSMSQAFILLGICFTVATGSFIFLFLKSLTAKEGGKAEVL
ncbi:MAG: MFS transporter [Breznakibacter sp.]